MKDKIKYIMTEHLDAMIGEDFIKLAVFYKKKSPYGWTKREMIYAPFGVDEKDFNYEYVRKAVDKVYSKFPYEEINELLNKINKYYERNKI